MISEGHLVVSDDFDYMLSFLPQGWQAKAKELGALHRCRKVPDAETLLRVLLIHLAEGCSLRETALRAREGKIIDLSDVAIMDRLRQSGRWFQWMNRELASAWVNRQPEVVYGNRWNVRLIDATRVKEPGPTGSSWCIHYAIDLPSLRCTELIVTGSRGNGEAFSRFKVKGGDLLIGDRAYGTASGISYALGRNVDVLVRFGWRRLELWQSASKKFSLLRRLRSLEGTKPGNWDILLKHGDKQLPGRVCAIKKSPQAAQRARQLARRKAQKNGNEIQPETLEAAGYTFVFTSVKAEHLSAAKVLEMYRGRWQIELVFKRLKSILGLGHLRKVDPTAAISWIEGKLFVALLMEALLRQGESIFPWGYPLRETQLPEPVPMERGGIPIAPDSHRSQS